MFVYRYITVFMMKLDYINNIGGDVMALVKKEHHILGQYAEL